MTHVAIGMLAVIGSISVVSAGVPEQIEQIFAGSLAAAQEVSTAGDLHTMSVMLDASYVMDRRLPKDGEFSLWLKYALKENNVKDLDKDHWGNKYVYTVLQKNRAYRLTSMGADGILGTNDDMTKTGP